MQRCENDPSQTARIRESVARRLGLSESIRALCQIGGWAYASLSDTTLLPVPRGGPPPILLKQQIAGDWQIALPQTLDYAAIMKGMPGTLLNDAAKNYLSSYEPSNTMNSASVARVSARGYRLPWQGGYAAIPTCAVSNCNAGTYHGYRAVDFDLSPGGGAAQRVRAAKDGTVVFRKDESNSGGTSEDVNWYERTNMVVLRHSDNEYSWYLHLAYNSIPKVIQVGTVVARGQEIGTEGATGFADGVHLHFQVTSSFRCGDRCNRTDAALRVPEWTSGNTEVDFDEITWQQTLTAASNRTRLYSGNYYPFGSIAGTVRFADGQVASNATVVLKCCDSHTVATRVTDSQGVYGFDTVPSGAVTLIASLGTATGELATTVPVFGSRTAADIKLGSGACVPLTGIQSEEALLQCPTPTPPPVIPTPTPQPPPSASGWNQTFYRDNQLSSQCGSGNETDVYMFRDSDTDWRPPSGCPAVDKEWSVRMEREAEFQGGNYEFGMFYDDGARLYVDGQLLVDGWNATQHYESRYMSPGKHNLRLEYKNNAGHAIVQLWWRGPGALPANTESRDPIQWWVNYWGNQSQWQDAVGHRNEGTGFIDRQWNDNGPGFGIPNNHFSLRFERTVYFSCGVYRFHLLSDDGSRLTIDGSVVPTFDHFTSGTWDTTADVTFHAGSHELKVDYFENGGGARIYFDWTLVQACAPTATPTPVPSTPTPNPALSPNAQPYGGIFGGSGGNSFQDNVSSNQFVTGLHVCAGDAIDTLAIIYNTGAQLKHGESNGGTCQDATLQANEYIVAMKGYANDLTRQLTFETNTGRFIGPFGKATGTPFDVRVPAGGEIVGVQGRAGWLIDAIGAVARLRGNNPEQTPTPTATPASPLSQTAQPYGKTFGGGGGTPFQDTVATNEYVTGYRICAGDAVDTVMTRLNTGAQLKHGDSTGGTCKDVTLTGGEYIVSLTGYANDKTQQIALIANTGRVIGPFGKPTGTAFEVRVPAGGEIVGFQGRAGWLIDAIGAVARLRRGAPVSTPPGDAQPFGSIYGGSGGGAFIDLVTPAQHITEVKISSGESIDTLQMVMDSGPLAKHGESDGGTSNRVVLQSGEYLVAVSGYADTLLHALTFETNTGRRIGPFGKQTGAAFEIRVPAGQEIVGFRGRSGWLIDAIGVLSRTR
jgi:hypothetical protein